MPARAHCRSVTMEAVRAGTTSSAVSIVLTMTDASTMRRGRPGKEGLRARISGPAPSLTKRWISEDVHTDACSLIPWYTNELPARKAAASRLVVLGRQRLNGCLVSYDYGATMLFTTGFASGNTGHRPEVLHQRSNHHMAPK